MTFKICHLRDDKDTAEFTYLPVYLFYYIKPTYPLYIIKWAYLAMSRTDWALAPTPAVIESPRAPTTCNMITIIIIVSYNNLFRSSLILTTENIITGIS